jgi:GMP synthase-like glutamine amidotransferase
MKPVAILRFAPNEGPGYFATYLSAHGIDWRAVKIDAGDPVPADLQAMSGLALMGGPMSVNDDLPWIGPVVDLVHAAAAAGIPVIGHCLGGQLMAKAFGGVVRRSAVREIGWGTVDVLGNAEAVSWFGNDLREFLSFHWHGETFSIPPGAVRVAASAHCENQAFAMGPHFGMQCHVEMTPDLIEAWCRDWGREVAALAQRISSVQAPAEMLAGIEQKVHELHRVADRIYGRWVCGLSPR